MKKTKIKKVLAGLALVSAIAFTAAGCGSGDEVVQPEKLFTSDEATRLEDVRDDLSLRLERDSGYTVLSVDGFEGNETEKTWTAYTTARPERTKGDPFTVVFTGSGMQKDYLIGSVNTSIKTYYETNSYDNANNVYYYMTELVKDTYRHGTIDSAELQDMEELYDAEDTKEQKNNFFNIVSAFCEDKFSEEKDKEVYSDVMSEFWGNRSKLSNIQYQASANPDGSWSAVLQQSAETDKDKHVFVAEFNFDTKNLSRDMVAEALRLYIDGKGANSTVGVKDPSFVDDETVVSINISLSNVTLASTKLEDMSKTVFDSISKNIIEAQKTASPETGNNV